MSTLKPNGSLSGECLITLLFFSMQFWLLAPLPGCAAELHDPADRGEPGDAMIQEYLRQEAEKIESDFLVGIKSAEDWNQARPRFRQEYFDMLGLWPLPEKTPLHATVTRTLDRGDYVVDMLHYQSRPGLYVTGNLYRPLKAASGQRLPAILYVCGHSPRPRNGNKTAYQSHGIWFARHGYVCLVLDSLEMGELTCTHHGTYRDGRWWWLSRGYTPAGVECWNGIRGIDYLAGLPYVDPDRIGVTGISGGGAATFWIAAGDERVRAAAPVSGLSDLITQVPHRVINGHCDCMFLYNTYQWAWARVAGMVAPRPLLFVNSDADTIFPMDGNERVINQLERIYSLMGAGDLVDSVVSIGEHAYRQDIRRAAFRFMNTYLKNDPRPVLDSEVDLVTGASDLTHPIPPEQLRVFPQDSNFPKDALNGRIDYEFVPMARPELPQAGQFEAWKNERLLRLRQLSFHHFPARIPAAAAAETNGSGAVRLITEAPISIRLKAVRIPAGGVHRIWLYVTSSDLNEAPPSWLKDCSTEQEALYVIEPRGIGGSRWTTKNPPNYVERSHYLLGRTVDSGRVWDITAAARYLRALSGEKTEVYLAGEGAAAVLATYAALLEPDIGGLVLCRPPASHMDNSAPPLLGVLRALDIPQAIGMLAPLPLTLFQAPAECKQAAAEAYRLASAGDRLKERN
jgi:dienelactone hydrolase